MLGWLTNLVKMLSIPSSLVYDGGTLEEPSVHICRSSDSTMDPKYSLNVLVISLFLKIISPFYLKSKACILPRKSKMNQNY